jgi:tripartite-type tricarboxylate transporter receptor subunit TctC
VARINEIFAKIAALPEVQASVAERQAGRVVGGSPEQFAAFIRREVARWTPIIRDGGIRSE